MNRIAVLIPCFNEALTIRKVVEDFRAALPQAAIYVYDNASTDGTKIIRSVFRFRRPSHASQEAKKVSDKRKQ